MPLEIPNVVGVFYVLIGGTIFAILYAIIGQILDIYHRSIKLKVCRQSVLLSIPFTIVKLMKQSAKIPQSM